MDRLPKFCNKCGKELISNQVISQYDIYDGRPVNYTITLNCPDYSSLIGTRRTNGHFYTVEEVTKNSSLV